MTVLPLVDHGRGPVKRRFAKRAHMRMQRRLETLAARFEQRRMMVAVGDGTSWFNGKRFPPCDDGDECPF